MALRSSSFITAGPALLGFGIGAPGISTAVAQIEFDSGRPIRTTSSVTGLAATDFNGDGWPDLVTSEHFENLTLFENRGDGQFQRIGSHYDPGMRLSHLQWAHLEGDDHPDLVWITTYQDPGNPLDELHNLNAYYSGGSGRVEVIALGTNPPGGLAAGRLTNDVRADVVIVDGHYSSPATVRVFVDDGGGLQLAQTIDLPNNDNRDVVLGDMDDDGDLDICVLNLETSRSYYGYLKVESSQVVILWNDGSGEFSIGPSIPLPYGAQYTDAMPHVLVAGDLDGDGDLDLALAGASYYEARQAVVQAIESRDSGRSFVLKSSMAVGVALRKAPTLSMADLDTDGDLDFVVVQSPQSSWVLTNNGSFSFAGNRLELQANASALPFLADLNGDGQIDLASAAPVGASIHLNITPYSGPVVDHTPLKRGQLATLSVEGARPGERVEFLYTSHGVGISPGIRELGGLTLNLNDPIKILGGARANSSGIARLSFTVPPNAPLVEIVLQAVMRRGPGGANSVKTPFRTTRVVE